MTMFGDFVLALLEAALVEVLSRVPLDDVDPSARRAFAALRRLGYDLRPLKSYDVVTLLEASPLPDAVAPVNTRYTSGLQ